MNRRIIGPVAVLAGLAAAAVGLGSVGDRTPEPVATPPGWGGGSVPRAEAVTEDWAAVAGFGSQLVAASANACERGEPDCLSRVVTEMEARLDAQATDGVDRERR